MTAKVAELKRSVELLDQKNDSIPIHELRSSLKQELVELEKQETNKREDDLSQTFQQVRAWSEARKNDWIPIHELRSYLRQELVELEKQETNKREDDLSQFRLANEKLMQQSRKLNELKSAFENESKKNQEATATFESMAQWKLSS